MQRPAYETVRWLMAYLACALVVLAVILTVTHRT